MRILRVLALAALLLSLIGAPARSQAPEQAYLARPAPNAQKSDTNDYFVIAARPGAKVVQSLEVKNTSDDPIRLAVNPVDAVTKDQGGVRYEEASERADRVGSWIEVSRPEIRLAAGDVTRVRFTVRVPEDARKGVNLGALVLQDPASLDVQAEIPDRTVIAVQVNTPGKREADIFVTGVRVIPREDAMYLEVGISNNGSAFANGSGSLLLPEEVFEGQIEFGTFVPGTAINYPIRWTTDPEPGPYAAEIAIQYGNGGQTAEWSGTIDVTARAISQLESLRGTEGTEDSDGLGILPVVAGAGVIALIAVASILGRRGRSGPVTVPAVEAETLEPQPPLDRPGESDAVPEAEVLPAENEGGSEAADAAVEEPAEKSAPKKTTKKAGVKKTPAKKTTQGKKTAAKKTTQKKKTAVKKTATKKATSRKTTAKKTATKKTPRKRSSGEPDAPDPGAD